MFFNFSRTLWSIFSKTYSHVGKYWNSILKFGTGWWCRGTMIEYSNSAAIFFHCNFPWLLVVIQEVLFFLPLDSPGHFPSNFPFILSSSCCVHTFFHKFCVPTWNTSDPQTCNYIFLINKNNTPIHGSSPLVGCCGRFCYPFSLGGLCQTKILGRHPPSQKAHGTWDPWMPWDDQLPNWGVISEPLGMGSFGVVWAAHCESQVSGKGKGQNVFLFFQERMVIFRNENIFPPKNKPSRKRAAFGGWIAFLLKFFFGLEKWRSLAAWLHIPRLWCCQVPSFCSFWMTSFWHRSFSFLRSTVSLFEK